MKAGIQTSRALRRQKAILRYASKMICIPGLMLIVSAAALAQDKTGWGLSATIGASQINDRDGGEKFGGNGLGISAEFEYRFTPYFALGFGGFSLGEADDTVNSVDTQIKVRGFDLFGRAIWPISDQIDLFGRIGAANYYVDIEPGNVSIFDALFGEDAVELGLGVDFGRREKLAFRLEGRFFNGGKEETGALLMLGINYLF